MQTDIIPILKSLINFIVLCIKGCKSKHLSHFKPQSCRFMVQMMIIKYVHCAILFVKGVFHFYFINLISVRKVESLYTHLSPALKQTCCLNDGINSKQFSCYPNNT